MDRGDNCDAKGGGAGPGTAMLPVRERFVVSKMCLSRGAPDYSVVLQRNAAPASVAWDSGQLCVRVRDN